MPVCCCEMIVVCSLGFPKLIVEYHLSRTTTYNDIVIKTTYFKSALIVPHTPIGARLIALLLCSAALKLTTGTLALKQATTTNQFLLLHLFSLLLSPQLHTLPIHVVPPTTIILACSNPINPSCRSPTTSEAIASPS